jgi:SAM-dependent methyltransferase
MNRHLISQQYIRGHGIEIGAFHNPFPIVNPETKITYIDKLTKAELIEQYPEIKNHAAIPETDFVENGETLYSIPDAQYDFLISSHQLEHCEIPLAAIEHQLRVVKKGGYLFYAVPDKRFTFDKDRPVTSLEHLKYEYQLLKLNQKEDLNADLLDHYVEYLLNVDKIEPLEIRTEIAKERISKGFDVHYHCWDSVSLLKVFTYMSDSNFDIEFFSRAGHENLIVLRKI